VGSYALAFHGAPRLTRDMDLLVRPTRANAERVLAALEAFGFASLRLAAEDFDRLDQVLQLGVPPVRIDIMTSIEAVPWEEAWSGRATGQVGGVPTHFLGREQYVKNKRAIGRPKDLGDLDVLGEMD
jgi:hypothetical protein